MRHRFLMCPATHYRVEYSINAWMEGNRDRVQAETAQREWDALYALISEHAKIELIDPVPELPDLVFAGSAAFVLGNRAVLSRFQHEERRPEEVVWGKWLRDHGFEVIEVPEDIAFEGSSDCALSPDGGPLWMGYGFRTQLEAGDFLARTFDCEVVPLHLVERRFFDLTACFGMLEGGYLLYYPPAFDERSLREIERRRRQAVRVEIFGAVRPCLGLAQVSREVAPQVVIRMMFVSGGQRGMIGRHEIPGGRDESDA